MTELISVIIANYNRSSLLKKAINSIINQKSNIPFEWEIIIVDDGSSDNSKEIIEQYIQKYPKNIRVIFQQNQGVNVARNVGINALSALSSYTIILDNDDEIVLWCFDTYLKKWSELRIKWEYDSVFTIISYCQDENGTLLWDKKILWWKQEITFGYKDYLRTFFELREMMSIDKSSTYRDNPEFRFDEKQLIWEAILWVQIYRKMHTQWSWAIIIDHIWRLFRLNHGPRTSHNMNPERFINSAKSNEKILDKIWKDLMEYWLISIYSELLFRIWVNYILWWEKEKGINYLKRNKTIKSSVVRIIALLNSKILLFIFNIYSANH